jgi:hypothetical protein
VAVAAVTVARVAPKNTTLLVVVVLKFVPLMVTASPGLAEIGLKEVMVGWAIAQFKLVAKIKSKQLWSIFFNMK